MKQAHRISSVIVAVVAALGLVACGDEELRPVTIASASMPDHFPDEFIMPADATLVRSEGVLQLHVEAAIEDVQEFYREHLPEYGWRVPDDWDGVDPGGTPTIGLIVENAEYQGALAISEAEGDGSFVRINLNEPVDDDEAHEHMQEMEEGIERGEFPGMPELEEIPDGE